MSCSVLNPCLAPECKDCFPPGAVRSYMRFARVALSQIFAAKREAYTGLKPWQTFPIDRRLKPANRI